MRTVDRKGLVELLLGLKGATFLTVWTETDARLKKNPFGKVMKRNVVNVQANFHYDAAVERQLAREGKSAALFARGESWHEPYLLGDRLTPLCCKKGSGEPEYLRLRHLMTVGEPVYVDGMGAEVDVEQIRAYLPKPSEYANQGVDQSIRFVVYGLGGIRQVRVGGEDVLVA